MTLDPAPLLLIGFGRMGGAIGRAVSGALPILAHDPHAELPSVVKRVDSLDDPALPARLTVILAVKPQGFADLAPALTRLVQPGRLFVSIMAGISLDRLGAALGPGAAVIRAMPNIAALIGSGATAAMSNAVVSPTQREEAGSLLTTLGELVWLERETDFDAVTALSGSGPAYFYRMAEALVQAGISAGLTAPVATALTRQTMIGAAKLAEADAAPLDILRTQVTSPGGTTAAGLAEFDRDQVLDLLCRRVIAAAASRSQELASA